MVKPFKIHILFTFLAGFLFLSGFAQRIKTIDYKLNWEQNPGLILKEKTIRVPILTNHLTDKNNLPVFYTTINVEKNAILQHFSIINVKFSDLPENEGYNLQKNIVPQQLSADFNIRFRRGKPVGILKLIPLINTNGTIRKITSFTLEYSLDLSGNKEPKSQRRTALFTDNSVLADGTWYKFKIDTTGVYKLDGDFLKKLGLNLSSINPENIRIYGNGGALLPQANSAFRYDDLQENAIEVIAGNDGKFDPNDYILFYGRGPESWKHNVSDISASRHVNNIYSDYAYYFITTDKGPGKRIANQTAETRPADRILDTYHDFYVHEKDEVNLFANGQQWLGENFSIDDDQTFSFKFYNADNAQDIFIRVRGVAISSTTSSMQISLNGQQLMSLNFSGIPSGSLNLANSREAVNRTRISSENIQIGIAYQNNGNPSAKAFLDYIEIFGGKKLNAYDKQFAFRNLDAVNPGIVYEYRISNSGSTTRVWDVTDPIHPEIIENTGSGGTFSFKSAGSEKPKEFVVLNDTDYFLPDITDKPRVENQNLHALKNIDYLIITRDFLIPEAQRLADFHTENSGLTTKVVVIEQIYNEFGSGSPDLTAIRDFIRFLYLTADSEASRIRYVVFFGDATYDFKNKLPDNNNIVPAFQSYISFNLASGYVTDDYYAMMDEDEGELTYADQLDLATGRFPVSTLSEAKTSVDKTLMYYSTESYGGWRNTITLVADDPDKPSEFILQQAVDILAEDIKSNKPVFNLKKIYCDAYTQETSAGGERYPDVNIAIDNAMESGTLVINYFGHGGVNGWANERILEVSQVQNWKNKDKLALFITVTCEYSKFDDPGKVSAGEYTFLNPEGGSINMISTTREIFISVGQRFNERMTKYLFQYDGRPNTISEALMLTKNEFTSTQRLFVYYFGDPAMALALPQPDIRIEKINGTDVSQARDTLKALSHIRLDGVVTDQNGNPLEDFNGEISTTVYDKPLDKKTLDNDNFGRTMDFSSIESKIFQGRASVTNGRFTLEFVVPKDIRIAYGKSKLSFYANEPEKDKSGFDAETVIGGIDPDAPEDTTGPEINLYMNDENFVDGGNTNRSPVLLAILKDASGINTSITAVDHDIVAILDNDEANPIVLNDYYQTELDDFTTGKVRYKLRNLEPGNHSLRFKSWDTYNNLSEATLNFVVVDDSELVLDHVLNYPNPFVNHTEFWFNHNKPNEALQVHIQIFTLSGKLVKTIDKTVNPTGYLSREITWDGLDDFGNKIGKGVYIYKLKVRAVNSGQTAERIEKLVILQ